MKELLAKGSLFHGAVFTLRLANTGHPESRFSFSVSKKAVPGAAGRNLLRRRGYAAVQSAWARVKPGLSGLFSLKKGSSKPDFDAIRSDVENLLSKAGALRSSVE